MIRLTAEELSERTELGRQIHDYRMTIMDLALYNYAYISVQKGRGTWESTLKNRLKTAVRHSV